MTKEELMEDLENLKEWYKDDMLTDADDTSISLLCSTVLSVIENCIEIPENATNGDMIKRMFPDVVVREVRDRFDGNLLGYRTSLGGRSRDFWPEWWNAPYEIPK